MSEENTEAPKKKQRRGFRAMDPEKQRAIASAGGKKAHEVGTAHKFTHDEAVAAGRKGGLVLSQDRERMRELGRKGGTERGRRAAERLAAERKESEQVDDVIPGGDAA